MHTHGWRGTFFIVLKMYKRECKRILIVRVTFYYPIHFLCSICVVVLCLKFLFWWRCGNCYLVEIWYKGPHACESTLARGFKNHMFHGGHWNNVALVDLLVLWPLGQETREIVFNIAIFVQWLPVAWLTFRGWENQSMTCFCVCTVQCFVTKVPCTMHIKSKRLSFLFVVFAGRNSRKQNQKALTRKQASSIEFLNTNRQKTESWFWPFFVLLFSSASCLKSKKIQPVAWVMTLCHVLDWQLFEIQLIGSASTGKWQDVQNIILMNRLKTTILTLTFPSPQCGWTLGVLEGTGALWFFHSFGVVMDFSSNYFCCPGDNGNMGLLCFFERNTKFPCQNVHSIHRLLLVSAMREDVALCRFAIWIDAV